MSSYTNSIPLGSEKNWETKIKLGDNTCTLYVTTRSGSAARSIKVSIDVSSGISCVGGRSFYTDSDGRVDFK